MNVTSYDVKRAATGWGAAKVGIADLALLAGIAATPPDLLAPYSRAVSVAVRLADGVMDAIEDRPTPLYRQHYDHVNRLLEDIGLRVANLLQAGGARALPLPPSQTLDPEACTSYLSHKAVAVAAGIGWQGKSLLTVSPEFGPRIRLTTVLTGHDGLAPDAPLKNRCGKCTRCTDACPAGAIKNVNTASHYSSRDEALHFERCREMVYSFRELPFIGSPICGVCIRVCPFGGHRRSGRP